MRKIATPIIHALFLIPTLFIAMGSIELMARKFELLPEYIRLFEIPYLILTLAIIVISGILLFSLANRLIQSVEQLRKPSVADHLRQSIFFYFIIVYSLSTWIFSGYSGSEDDLYFLTMSSISLVSVAVNQIFLFKRLGRNGGQD